MKGPMAIRRLLWVAVPGFVALAGMESGMLRAQAQRPGQIVGGPGQVMSISVKPEVHIVVNFTELALQEELNPPVEGPATAKVIHAPMLPDWEQPGIVVSPGEAPASPGDDTGEPKIPSPPPAASFQAQSDIPKVGTGISTIPPDTMGAAGLSHLFSNTNSNYRIQNKAGGITSTVSINTFWGVACPSAFDPRVQYDPFNGRWLVAAATDIFSAASAFCVGISDTTDPTGTWDLFKVDADGANALSIDFPMLGFNKNWVAVSGNMFTGGGAFAESRVLTLNYPTLLTGALSGVLFTGVPDFCSHPVTTFSSTLATLYLPAHRSSAGATYGLNTITGTPGAPVYTTGANKVNGLGAWTFTSGNVLPQSGTVPVDVGDSFFRGNAVFRSSNIFVAHTIGLPSGGAFTRTAAQWVKMNTAGTFVDGGRIDDASATLWRAYPSITVNAGGDILLGYTQTSSSMFLSGAYSFHDSTDAAGTMRDPNVFKAGLGPYRKTFGAGSNRWGDYSHTVVDPSNDNDFWTIQEYADTPTAPGTTDGNGKWATWWAKVVPPVAGTPNLVVTSLTGPKYAASGGSASMKDTTKNTGTADAAASSTRFYFSANSSLDGGDTLMSGTHAVPLLTPGSSDTATTVVTLPASSPGKRFIIAKADQPGTIAESNEADNTKSRVIYIGPDLTIKTLSAPASAARGSMVAISDTTKNAGAVTTGVGSTTRYYLSTNSKWDAGDTPLAAGRAVPVLGAGASNSGGQTVTIPMAISAGSYFIIARSDDGGAVTEALETNNTKSKSISIT